MKIDWNEFCRQNYRKLHARAVDRCKQFGVPVEYADEAVRETVRRLVPTNIRPLAKNPALCLAYIILRNVVADRGRQLGRQTRITRDREQWESTETILGVLLRTKVDPRREDLLHCARQMRALVAGFDVLPLLLSRRFPRVSQYLALVWRVAVDGGTLEDDPEANTSLTPAERRQLCRGRELLRGWVDRMCGTSRGPQTGDERYYWASYEAAKKYVEDEEE